MKMTGKLFEIKSVLLNGKLASTKNASKIIAYSTVRCTNVIHRDIDPDSYYELWKLVKEKQGYIFREVIHGGAINGHHKTVKQAVAGAATFYPRIKVILKDTVQ